MHPHFYFIGSIASDSIVDSLTPLQLDVVNGLVAGIAVGLAYFSGKLTWRAIKSLSDSRDYESNIRDHAMQKLRDLNYPDSSIETDASSLVEALKWNADGSFDSSSHSDSIATIDRLQAWSATPSYTGHGVLERQESYDSFREQGFDHSTSVDLINGEAQHNTDEYGFSYASYPDSRQYHS